MKNKIISAIIAALICIISIVPSFADDSGGYFTPYKIIVSTEPGAVLYDRIWNDDMTRSILRPLTVLAPVGTELTVTDELEFDGEIYLAVEYSGFSAYIKQSKSLISIQNVGEEAAYPTKAERSVAVINPEGVCLRKGPSFAYEASSEAIPFGTVISYSLTNCEEEAYAQWAYTEYKGVKGWLYIYNYGATKSFDCAKIIDADSRYTGLLETLTDGAYLTETPDIASAKTVENIPAGTRLSFKYFYEFYDSISAFVEYNGVKGWLRTRNSAYKVATGEKGGIYVLAEKGLPIYEKPFDENSKPFAVVPANTNLCVDYVFWDAELSGDTVAEYKWMHVNFNGKDGWIFSGDSSDYCYMLSAFDLKINADGGLDLYDAPNAEAKVISTVPKNSTVTCIYEITETKDTAKTYWSYVEYNGKQGWIFSAEGETELVAGSEKQLSSPFGAQPVTEEEIPSAPEFVDKKSYTVFIIAGVGAAALIAVIIAVVVIKKKKSE